VYRLIQIAITITLINVIGRLKWSPILKLSMGKHLSDVFRIKNRLRQGDALSPLLFNSALE
jgi:hypothetical protein